jgi:hypothetical protein
VAFSSLIANTSAPQLAIAFDDPMLRPIAMKCVPLAGANMLTVNPVVEAKVPISLPLIAAVTAAMSAKVPTMPPMMCLPSNVATRVHGIESMLTPLPNPMTSTPKCCATGSQIMTEIAINFLKIEVNDAFQQFNVHAGNPVLVLKCQVPEGNQHRSSQPEVSKGFDGDNICLLNTTR